MGRKEVISKTFPAYHIYGDGPLMARFSSLEAEEYFNQLIEGDNDTDDGAHSCVTKIRHLKDEMGNLKVVIIQERFYKD